MLSHLDRCLPQHTSCKHFDHYHLQADYRQPYVRGTSDPLKTALEGTLFNNRKTSGVFNSGGCLCNASCLGSRHANFHNTAVVDNTAGGAKADC